MPQSQPLLASTVPRLAKITMKDLKKKNYLFSIIEICSGITCGRVLNVVLYAQRSHKLNYCNAFNYSISVIFVYLFIF